MLEHNSINLNDTIQVFNLLLEYKQKYLKYSILYHENNKFFVFVIEYLEKYLKNYLKTASQLFDFADKTQIRLETFHSQIKPSLVWLNWGNL